MPKTKFDDNAEMLARLGVQIRKHRKQLNMTQSELGRRMTPRMSHAAVSDAERGVTNSGLLRLRQFAAALRVQERDLLFEPQSVAVVLPAGAAVVDITPEELESMIGCAEDFHWEKATAARPKVEGVTGGCYE